MARTPSPGARFREALRTHRPLQIVGTLNAYSALLAQRAGHQVLYISGAGVANASLGLPDLGLTTLQDVLTDVDRISSATQLPLLVDIDTGWGGAFAIARTIKAMEKAGAAAVHLEDQVAQKRCGHRPHKAIVSCAEMVDRVKAAVDARIDADFVIMARTDAIAVEGLESGIERALACVEAGADAVFPEAVTTLEDYRRFSAAVPVPILANLTEFGLTPQFNTRELAAAGVAMTLYPLSAFRAMSRAAEQVYGAIARDGDQKAVLDSMQTRAELYEVLDYLAWEQKLDALYGAEDGTQA